VERGDLMSAYYRRLTGDDEAMRQKAAVAWTKWECSTSRLLVDPVMVKKATDDIWAYAFARIEWYVQPQWGRRGCPTAVRPVLTMSEGSGGLAAVAKWMCSHYFVHGGWFERDRQLIDDAHKIAHIPTTIVQGVRYWPVPTSSAWQDRRLTSLR
jgi:proline iminopeptidase